MWNEYDEIMGVPIVYQSDAWSPFIAEDKVQRFGLRKPFIALNRQAIHKLAQLQSGDIVKFLYAGMGNCERAATARQRQEWFNQDLPVRVPRGKVGHVYFVRSPSMRLIKIGCTSNLYQRMNGLRSAHGQDLILLTSYNSNDMYFHEAKFHQLFRSRRQHGEWFSLIERHIKIADRAVARGWLDEVNR